MEIYASDFVVTDEKNKYVGILSMRKHKLELIEKKSKELYNPIIDTKVPSVSTDQTLADALNVIMYFDVDKVAVSNYDKCLGYLRSKDIYSAYIQTVKK